MHGFRTHLLFSLWLDWGHRFGEWGLQKHKAIFFMMFSRTHIAGRGHQISWNYRLQTTGTTDYRQLRTIRSWFRLSLCPWGKDYDHFHGIVLILWEARRYREAWMKATWYHFFYLLMLSGVKTQVLRYISNIEVMVYNQWWWTLLFIV